MKKFMTPKFKHFSVISISSLWALLLLYICYIDDLSINGKPLIAERLSIATIIGPLIFIYLIFNHHTKPKDKKKLSALSFGFWGMGGFLVVVVIDILFSLDYEDFFILVVAFIAGIIHLILGFWTYENSGWDGRNSTVKSRQSNIDYEVINFSQVGEVVSKVNEGDWNVFTSDEYRTEVIDAAKQAVSENVLKSVTNKLQLLGTLQKSKREKAIKKHLTEVINELDDNTVNQIYPLIADKEEYLDYFYKGDQKFKDLVVKTILDINQDLTSQKLEKAYNSENPCSEYWPVISSKIDAYSK